MIVAIDASTNICGIAARSGAHLHLDAIRVLDEPGDVLVRTVNERIWPALNGLHERERVQKLVIEWPPDTITDDGTGRAKRQAVVGLGLGRAMMMFELWGYLHGVPVVFGKNSDWRRWASRWATSSSGPPPRPVLKAPPRRTAKPPKAAGGGSFVVAYEGCEHTQTYASYQKLVDRPDCCPTCEPPSAAVDRLAHKEPWVDIAHRAWPAEVERLAERLRGRSKAQRLHQIPGVADACDAALMLEFVRSGGAAGGG